MGVITFVRHGQASTGAADYDVLSPLGEQQAGWVGTELCRRDIVPNRVISGALRRQHQTAAGALLTGGWHIALETDPCWDEFDHTNVLGVAGHPGTPTDPVEPDRAVSPHDTVIPRWSSGLHDAEYSEPFSVFTKRVEHGLDGLTREVGRGQTAVVFTSAGVIAWVAALLLGGGEPQWRALNRVVVNGSITKVTIGGRGATLISFNEHAHLAAAVTTYS